MEVEERIYTSNGAAAYDIYTLQLDNTALQPELPQGLPEEEILPQKQQRVKAKTAVAPFTLFGLAAAVCMLILVIFGYVQLFEATTEVSNLETKLSQLQNEQAMLKSKYEGKVDLEQVEQRAGELGLFVPTEQQKVYLNLSGSDRAEITEEVTTNWISEVFTTLEESVENLIAYLRPAAA